MIKHIVFLKKSGENPGIISDITMELVKRLRVLENKIEEIHSIEVGINTSNREYAYDISLLTSFINEADLNTYRFHPEHLLVIDYIKKNDFETAVVDYNI